MGRSFSGTERYHVVRELGEGSFGAVYDVLDRERGAHVALKLLTRFDAPSLYRFKGEFRAFADVHHANLVQLYELGSDGDDWFFTMELVQGVDWLRFVREHPRRFDDVAATMPASDPVARQLARERTLDAGPKCDVDRLYAAAWQLASGVHALHTAGIVHRDVKPSNVLVDRGGRVVLVDFGLARPIASGRSVHTGVDAVGTPAYMAPEQATRGEITGAADWYAVGAMLFEALTGRLPFDGPPLEIIAKKQMEAAPRVRDELASAPRELEELCDALLARDPAARPSGERVLEVLASHRPSRAPSASTKVEAAMPAERVPFVGRKQPMVILEAAYHRATAGDSVIALLRGASGIGKSALARAFADGIAAPAGAVVLSGRCYEREAVSYKAFDSAIDALSRALVLMPPELSGALLPRDTAALARVFPVLDRVPTIAQAPRRALDAVDGQQLRRRAFAALRELLARLGDRKPLVLVLDDFQWADAESVALLRDVTRGEPRPAMLVIVTFREEDVGKSAPLDALLESLRELDAGGASRDVEKVPLEPLTSAESRELAAAALERPIDDPLVASIASESGGSPFFLGELVQFVLSSDSAEKQGANVRLSTVLQDRLARLDERERRLLEVLAIAGRPLERRVACQAAQIELADAEPPFRVLHRAKLVRTVGSERDDRLECFHNRIREAVVASLTPNALREHHQRLAAALQSLREPDPEALFMHYEAAGVSERAAEYALLSAERAGNALAFEHAARLYGSALDLLPKTAPDRHGIILRAAESLFRAGRGPEAADVFLRAVDDASPRDVLSLRQRAAEALLFSGQLDRGLRIMGEICAQVDVRIPQSRAQAIVQLLFLMVVVAITGRRFRPRDPATVTGAELTRADVCWAMAAGLSLVDQVIARPFGVRAVLTARRAGDAARMARALSTEAGFRSSEGTRARANVDWLFAQTTPIHAIAKDAAEATFTRGVKGWSHYFFGDWTAAKSLIDEALGEMITHGYGSIWERDTLQVYTLMSRIYLGELGDLARLTERALYDARNRGDLFLETILAASRINVRWMLEDAPAAKRRDVDDALRRWGQPGRFQIQHWYALQSLAQVDLYEGNPLNALRRIEEAWPKLRRNFLLRVQNVRVEARATRAIAALGVLATEANGGSAELLATAERDATAIARERTAWSDGLALLLRAGIARRTGDDARAAQLLDKAIAAFDAQKMALHAAVSRLGRATVAGGDAAKEPRREAERYFGAQSIDSIDRVAAIFGPTFAARR